jgi:hypothetical protein
MNKTKQFWALLKFQTTINPFVWFLLLAFGGPLFFMEDFSSSYHPNLPSQLMTQNLFMVAMAGLWIIAPEMAQPWGTTGWSSGTEFLLTRAIDRPVLYRAKAAFLYFFVLLTPMVSVAYSLKHPDLKATEYSAIAQKECLSHVPGAVLEPNPNGSKSPLIVIPQGNVLVEEWHFWMFAASAFGIQVLLLTIYPSKHRTFIFYAIFMIGIFVPLWINLHSSRQETLPSMERLFFNFAAHQTVFWVLTAFALILGQFWCERRFASLEQ